MGDPSNGLMPGPLPRMIFCKTPPAEPAADMSPPPGKTVSDGANIGQALSAYSPAPRSKRRRAEDRG
jgi:hypothetical protein